MDASRDSVGPGPWSQWVAALSCSLCFLTLCFFYGSDVNLVVFLSATFVLIVGLSASASSLARVLPTTPWAFALTALGLASLILSYQFSLSKDSSFVPTWVLALTPLGYLVARGAGERVVWLHSAIALIVVMFAVLSCARLLVLEERASLPLSDPNNYASLLYLVLLPLLHGFYVRCSGPVSPRLAEHVGVQAACFVLAMALFATQSRAGQLILLVALVVWGGFAVSRRLRGWPVLTSAFLIAVAYLVGRGLAPDVIIAGGPGVDASLEVRAALVSSALSMYENFPITGIGIYVFPLMYRQLRHVIDQDTAGLFVHNDYVQFLAEGGPLLLVVLLAFGGAVVLSFVKGLQGRCGELRFERLGLVMALGAVLAHALVNFVFFSPSLGLLIGVTAARAFAATDGGPVPTPPADRTSRLGIAGAVAFAWLSWLYLGLDTATAGVLQNQRYVPFAASVRQDPGTMLRYARAAQALNGHRGVPVLAEAALLDQRLRQEPNSVYLREQALNAFRRAGQADPWNPLTQMLMIRFIEANPAILPQLREDETPESLLLRAVAIDPLYVPAVDALIDRLTREKRHAQAYGLLRDRVYPWMILLARQDKAAAQRYLQFLQTVAEARDERAFAAELAELRPVIEGTREVVKARWLF